MKYDLFAAGACAILTGMVGAATLPAPLQAQTPDTVPIVLPALDVRVSRSVVPPERLPFAITSTRTLPGTLAGGTAVDGALRGIPGVQVSNRFNDAIGERVTIRGMGARAQFGIRGIRVLVDGIPATMPDGQTTLTHLDASAVTSAEVLRGAAGALWGNASGGVVQLRTAPLSSRFATARLSQGSDGLQRISASAAVEPATDAVLHARVASQKYDGYRAFSESSKVLGSIGGSWSRNANRVWIGAHAVDYDAQNPGSLSTRQLDSARLQANPNNVRQQTGERGTHVQLGAGWQRDFGGGVFEMSAYGLQRDLVNPIPPSIIELERSAGGARAVLSGALSPSLLLSGGVEASVQSDDRTNYANDEGANGALTLSQDERVSYVAPFVQGVVELSPSLDALAAVRYDRYTFRADDRLVNAQDPDDSGTRTLSAPTAAVGLRLRQRSFSIYGNYATSFQTPTTTELANRPDGAGGFNPMLEPEKARSLEIGGDMSVGRVRVNIAAYQTHISNALIPFEVPAAPGRQFFRNAGSVVNTGVEIGARAALHERFALSAALGYGDAQFDEYVVGSDDYSGNRVPGVADRTFDASADWRAWRDAGVTLALRHSGDVAVNDANAAVSPAYTLLDATVQSPALHLDRMSARVTAGISNMADVAYNTAVAVNAFGGRFYEPGPGRTLFVSISAGVGRSPDQ